MDKIDEILIGTYREKCLKYTISALYPLFSGMIIFAGALLIVLLNQTASNNTSPFLPVIMLVLIILAEIIIIHIYYYNAKYNEYNRKYTTLIIKELVANSANTSYEEFVKEIVKRTLFDEKGIRTILFRLLSE